MADTDQPLLDGAIALVCEEGRVDFDEVQVRPAGGPPSPPMLGGAAYPNAGAGL